MDLKLTVEWRVNIEAATHQEKATRYEIFRIKDLLKAATTLKEGFQKQLAVSFAQNLVEAEHLLMTAIILNDALEKQLAEAHTRTEEVSLLIFSVNLFE